LAERDDFKQLGQDTGFQEAGSPSRPSASYWNNKLAAAIWRDADKADALWNLTLSNYDDLTNYLQTGRSAKYDSVKILAAGIST